MFLLLTSHLVLFVWWALCECVTLGGRFGENSPELWSGDGEADTLTYQYKSQAGDPHTHVTDIISVWLLSHKANCGHSTILCVGKGGSQKL